MGERGQGMVAFLGAVADERLAGEDLVNLPDAEQRREPPVDTHAHDRLVALGSLLTGTTLVVGTALTLYGGWQVLLRDGGALDAVLAAVGVLLVGTHWGWVHVAEYLGVSIDERRRGSIADRRRDWLAGVQPHPRFSVATSVLDDASTRIERVLHQPVLTERGTFTFARRTDAERTFDPHTSAAVIAAEVEAMRRQARLQTDRLRELWEAASTTYAAAMLDAHDDHQRLLAQRAAATALSEHLNASLLEPPLAE